MQQANSHEETELLRLENQAIAAEASEASEQAAQDLPAGEVPEDFTEELTDVLDTLAGAGSVLLPTVEIHFNHAQNEKIAKSMIKLAEKYGYDLKGGFIGENSIVMLWLGVAYTVGVPARACFDDYRIIKEKEVKDAPAETMHETRRTATHSNRAGRDS